MIKKMDIYQLKFVITYFTSYLDEFIMLCEKRWQLDPKIITFYDEFDPDIYERLKDTYEIPIDMIFNYKCGQYHRIVELFKELNFETIDDKKSKVQMLRI